MITVHKADQLKRFAPFLYLSHSFILSLNVKVCITFIVLLQISLCFFLCQESYWMRGVCISLTSSCFFFLVGGGTKKFEDLGRGGGGLKILGQGGWGVGGGLAIWGYFCWGCQYPMLYQ